MATKAVWARLTRDYRAGTGCGVAIESVGGVEAAARVQAGEPFDVVLLARDAIDRLLAAGHLVADGTVDLVRSDVAVAVRRGVARPDIGTEAALRQAVLAARTIGLSTGPSGMRLAELFARWGVADQVRAKVVTPTPGTPVGSLVARGEIELGFQQHSELIHVDGIDVLGLLPPPIQIVTTFSGAVGAHARQPEAARALLGFMASPMATDAKVREGMQPA
jgi:molybdate transport system substrate-binding protein